MSHRRPTLQDVAQAANVSMMTVSRALNGHDRVSPETRERVVREAERLGYRPSSTARSLRANQSFLIGVFTPNLMMPLHTEMVLGVQHGATELGYQVLMNVDMQATGGRPAFVSDGDVIMGRPSVHQSLTPDADPRRTVALMSEAANLDAFNVDLALATQHAFEHLWERGYRRIALVQLPRSPAERGLQQWATNRGVPVDAEMVRTVEVDGTGVKEAIDALLQLPEFPDAMVVVSVAETPQVIRELHTHGVRPGHDLGFVGTEGSRGGWSDLLTPAITTIQVPGYDLGMAAARRLVERLRGDTTPPIHQAMTARLVVRGSTPPQEGDQ